MTENSFDDLVLFIRKTIHEYKNPIDRDTLIENDLGVTGEEAADLILQYGHKFHINISNFLFSKYFYEEPSIFLESTKVQPFTVGHLEKGILVGRLDEEVINS